MKKLFKSLLTTLLVSMVFIGLLGVNASADTNWGSDTEATLTLVGAEPNDKFQAWLVVKITYDQSTNSLNYEFTQAAEAYFSSKGVDINKFMTEYNSDDKTNFNALLAELPEEIYKDYDGNETLVSGKWKAPIGGSPVADSQGKVTIPNCKAGGYFIMPVETTEVYQPIFVALIPSINTNNQYVFGNQTYEIAVKHTSVNVKTEIKKNNETDDYTTDNVYVSKSTIDSDVENCRANVRVTIDVPKYTSEKSQTIKLVETLPQGVKYVANSLKVYDESQNVINHYVFNPNTMTIDFSDYYSLIKNNSKLITEFTVEVGEDAAFAGVNLATANTIESTFTYTTYPYKGSTNPAFTGYKLEANKVDDVTIKTLGIDIYKFGNDIGDALANAKFNLYRLDENGDVDLKVGTNVQTEKAFLLKSGLVTDSYGTVKIEGLEENDNFYLLETVAPTGYIRDDVARKVTVNESEIRIDNENHKTGYVRVQIKNNKANLVLPTTGATGMVAFTIVGLGIMASAIVILVSTKRNKTQH